ncbi:arginyl-tRNA synthetase [Allocatelliglobosispora scoriae]|uniref:Arginine--tRNA ligase n=1 Tax=Allocatelliglobosispora scoriae TaxID=643052 RepID=A0A841BUY6_9ACTN|nr:arginine--tRNA ligase [Allocatelliglobosispora scoriae]MBB5872014.1 arginyl-tRNA synthetase [Allocatelliglobosispora scoriae]
MTPENLADLVLAAARTVFDVRGLDHSVLPEATTVERPRNPEHGDYASNIAMQVAKRAGVNPRELAQAIADQLSAADGVAAVEVAGPGFLNVRLDAGTAGRLAESVVLASGGYGHSKALAGERLNLEFVSANPTGPIHLGGVRWAAVGDALARLLRATGAEVTTEYYFNDAGAQIDRFAMSLLASAKGEPTPEDGYGGEYISDIASTVVAKRPDVLDAPDPQEVFRVEGIELMFAQIKESLAEFGTHFDVFFNEKDLHDRGELQHALTKLREQGHTFEADGATWLRTTDFGDDKDRVIVRSNGVFTYFAADCAYYLDKRERGFDRVIIMLGADHHGYVGRMRAMSACFGDDPDRNLEILIGQMVNLVRDGAPVRMSKRAGTVVSMEDLVEAIGIDASRYALARYSSDSPIDIDVELWTRATRENPVYYVQYVAARTAGVSRNAADVGLTRDTFPFDPALLDHPMELELLKALAGFPAVVRSAAERREPHKISHYLEEVVAQAFHRFYDSCRVLPMGDEEISALHVARLWLNDATRQVIVNGLTLLGVSAPERM